MHASPERRSDLKSLEHLRHHAAMPSVRTKASQDWDEYRFMPAAPWRRECVRDTTGYLRSHILSCARFDNVHCTSARQ